MHQDEQASCIISNSPVGIQAIGFISGLAQNGKLGERTRLRIAIYLAAHGHSIFPLVTLRHRGRAVGMNGAEMNANEQGSSHDAMDTACLLFVKSMMEHAAAPTALDLQGMYAVGYALNEILEVMAQVCANRLLARMNEVIAAPIIL